MSTPYNSEARMALFNHSLKDFSENHVSDLITSHCENLKIENRDKIGVGVFDNAAKTFLEFYENIRVNHILNIITPQDETPKGKNDKIDIYKILSATEYSIMYVRPIMLKYEDNFVDGESNLQLYSLEGIINAHFAFNFSLFILSNWDSSYGEKGEYSYAEFLKDQQIIKEIITYKEGVRKDDMDVMSMGEEHIAILAMNNGTAPIFTNSTWWRMFCLSSYMLSKLNKAGIKLD